QRYASMAEMARAVEALGAESSRVPAAAPATPIRGAAAPARSPRPNEPVLTALPAVSGRARLSELCGSMLLSVLFTGLGTVLWAAIGPKHSLTELSTVFLLTVAACWAVLAPSKFWTERRGDSWMRRFALLVVGGLVGLGGWWLDGWSVGLAPVDREAGASLLAFVPPQGVTEAAYFSYFALAFFAMR